ncbi:MAG: hypothetical protein CSB24_04480 [Deltaproteobacteria bacterium]|nr:MAG: hypothetical protein CSB24_04480 [Deltaproteobacteria bacterium]
MSIDCPGCGKSLQIGKKAESSIVNMPAGKLVKVKCTGCGRPFGINSKKEAVDFAAIEAARKQSEQAAPKTPAPPAPKAEKKNVQHKALTADGKPTGSSINPPEPPDIAWLVSGQHEDQEVVEDVPLSLVLMPDTPARATVINAIEGIGYLTEMAASPQEAIDKMLFVNYSNVVLHSSFEGGSFEDSSFHHYMTKMEMSKRRYIFYTLIGPEFKTLYNLQALACSANLVVNDSQVKYFNTILRKVIPEYETLFGPLMEELHVQGR